MLAVLAPKAHDDALPPFLEVKKGGKYSRYVFYQAFFKYPSGQAIEIRNEYCIKVNLE